jgi:hypothetical protein
MVLDFEADDDLTLDNSVHIIVRSMGKNHEEYVYQFAVNKEEIINLREALKEGLKLINQEERLRKRNRKLRSRK